MKKVTAKGFKVTERTDKETDEVLFITKNNTDTLFEQTKT